MWSLKKNKPKRIHDFNPEKTNTGTYNFNVEAVGALGCWKIKVSFENRKKSVPFKRLFDLTFSSQEFRHFSDNQTNTWITKEFKSHGKFLDHHIIHHFREIYLKTDKK